MASPGLAGSAWALGKLARAVLLSKLQGATLQGLAHSLPKHDGAVTSGRQLLAIIGQARLYSSLPPHTVLNMPALSPTMTQGNIAKWHVAVGDEVRPGTILADVETDKATLGFENQDEGYVAKVLLPDGSRDVPIGTPALVLVEDKAAIAAFANYSSAGASPLQATAPAPPAAAPSKPAPAPAVAATSKSYPPHTKLAMPSLSPTMERGNIVSWKVKAGDAIKPGDIIAEVETDKATLGFENQDEGFIAKILVPDGTRDISVGTTVAIIVEEAETVSAFTDYGSEAVADASPAAAAAEAAPAAEPGAGQGPKVVASSRLGPAARILLESAGLTVNDVTPTGPNNIVTKGDVLAAITAGVKPKAGVTAAAPAAAAAPKTAAPAAAAAVKAKPGPPAPPGSTYSDTPNSQIRRIIAQRLLDSKRLTPAVYASADAPLDAVKEFRATLASQGTKVSVNDIVLKAVAAALRDVPAANSFWDDKAGAAKPFPSVDICVAVATDKGLITPIVKAADTKSLTQISKEVRDLAMRARDNKLKPEEFQGGSFTVSNLGMYGLSEFSAIINPPQACILAVGGAQQKVVLRDGKPVAQTYMTLTLSADHRVYDGELLAALLAALSKHIANPVNLLL